MRQVILFANIRAELARRNYGVKEVAEALGLIEERQVRS